MNIALTFSGGGYRAASFSLGVISYLSKVQLSGGSLLDKVAVLSTVSGGTITGAKYALGLKQGKSIGEIFDSLYKFMSKVDLVSLALERLSSKEGWDANRTRSLINAVADIYDAYLFENEKFEAILSNDPSLHLRHISFNATEFANALQFRFQRSEEILNPADGEPAYGIIGNHYIRVPMEIARHFRLADILAASSCFPGGFEPINFPNDFILPPSVDVREFTSQAQFPVGLMDGGIVDNQGIAPVLLAETRIKRNQANVTGSLRNDKALDLIIISDVASPYMENYKASIQKTRGAWRCVTPKFIFVANSILLLLSAIGGTLSYLYDLKITLIVSTFLFTCSVLLFLIARLIKAMPGRMHIPAAFLKPIGRLLRLKLGTYESMLSNRLDSLLKMSNDVFLKHIRRLNYQTIFNDPAWENRRIMTAIYELKLGEERISKKIKSGVLAADLEPGSILQQVATEASAMGTTLWFTAEELKRTPNSPHNVLDKVIACGQFTMCWNLLEFIGKLKKSDHNTTSDLKTIFECEEQLKNDWLRFKENPFWFTSAYHGQNKDK